MVANRKNARALAKLDPAIVKSVCNFARRQATLAGDGLRVLQALAMEIGVTVDLDALPQAFFLELAAVAQLGVWENDGITPLISEALPQAVDAEVALFEQLRLRPQGFRDADSAVLSRRLLSVWLERFHWSAPELLGADHLLGDVDEDLLVEAIAQLLWNHRGELRRLLGEEN